MVEFEASMKIPKDDDAKRHNTHPNDVCDASWLVSIIPYLRHTTEHEIRIWWEKRYDGYKNTDGR